MVEGSGEGTCPSPEIYQVSRVYYPTVSCHICELLSDAEESSGAASSHSVVLAASSIDVPTFDLNFYCHRLMRKLNSFQTVLLPCLCEVR